TDGYPIGCSGDRLSKQSPQDVRTAVRFEPFLVGRSGTAATCPARVSQLPARYGSPSPSGAPGNSHIVVPSTGAVHPPLLRAPPRTRARTRGVALPIVGTYPI